MPLHPRPRGARHSTAVELTPPTAQDPTASSRFVVAGSHLLSSAQERARERGLRLWARSKGLGERGREGLRTGKWMELQGRARPAEGLS